MTYEVKINRKSVYKVEQKKPCLFKGVKVFASQPMSHTPGIEGKIKNLYYETSGIKYTKYSLFSPTSFVQIKLTMASA